MTKRLLLGTDTEASPTVKTTSVKSLSNACACTRIVTLSTLCSVRPVRVITNHHYRVPCMSVMSQRSMSTFSVEAFFRRSGFSRSLTLWPCHLCTRRSAETLGRFRCCSGATSRAQASSHIIICWMTQMIVQTHESCLGSRCQSLWFEQVFVEGNSRMASTKVLCLVVGKRLESVVRMTLMKE